MAVLQIYAVALIANTPGNVLVLMLIAQGRHGIIGTLVLVEACMNLALSIVLSHFVGPIGVAISSLTMIALDDLLVIPFVASRRLGIPLRQLAVWIGSGLAIGLAIAGTIHVVPVYGLTGFLVRLRLGAVVLAAVLLLAWRTLAGHRTVASGEDTVPDATDY